MSTDKIKIICATRDLQIPPLLQTATFFQTPYSPSSVKYFMHVRKTFIARHSVIQRRSDLIIPRMRAAMVQSKSFACVGQLDNPCIWNYYPCHLSSRKDDLRLSCLLTQALMPLRPVREHCYLEWSYV